MPEDRDQDEKGGNEGANWQDWIAHGTRTEEEEYKRSEMVPII